MIKQPMINVLKAIIEGDWEDLDGEAVDPEDAKTLLDAAALLDAMRAELLRLRAAGICVDPRVLPEEMT
jgi:hypothetical protein